MPAVQLLPQYELYAALSRNLADGTHTTPASTTPWRSQSA